MVRPWRAALGLVVCGLIWLGAYAYSVGFAPADLLSGLGRAAAGLRLEGIAMALHLQAAALSRAQVRALRDLGAGETARQEARFALADDLRSAALLAHVEGDEEPAEDLVTEAIRAAPERVDLRCLLVDMRSADLTADERRVALLRLVYETDAACAHLLAGRSFLEAGDGVAAEAYLQRAAELRPDRPEPHLLLAELYRREGDRDEALRSAQAALANAQDLRTRLEATDCIRMAGGVVPERRRLIAEHAWRNYRQAGVPALAFLVFLLHPLLVSAARRRLARRRGQRSMADSAS